MFDFGSPLYNFDCITSTNDEAKSLARTGAMTGTLVTAAFQTAGKGRLNRTWESESGLNFLGSYIVHPSSEPSTWNGLSLLAGIAVADVITELTSLNPRLKWPNDVLIKLKKAGGILIETSLDQKTSWAVIGIGCNINQKVFSGVFRTTPTSLVNETGVEYSIETFTNLLSKSLQHWYLLWEKESTVRIVQDWEIRSDMIGKTVIVENGSSTITGIVSGIRRDGRLELIDQDGKTCHIPFGEVHFQSV